ncbi:MAG: viperin family antiviral radical SAM protein [Myxococcota bacterium]|jgi:radical S-adenosyl methionine domain-containing protein 2|nr:viperin family antiviral radical SAM protein [Myxococcota bacterium]
MDSQPAKSTSPLEGLAVNFHLTAACNYRCRFCFAHWPGGSQKLSKPEVFALLRELFAAGARKLTFAGGEPTLEPGLGQLIQFAKSVGFVTGIVSNGARFQSALRDCAGDLDWAGLSLDSASEQVQAQLGRGQGDHVRRTIANVEACHAARCRVKLNTVVTALNWDEDLSALIAQLRPQRWKVFQVLRVLGQNDGRVDDLLIERGQYRHFVERHRHLEREGMALVAEDNEAMLDSYVMINPSGCFYGNSNGEYRQSRPILELGVDKALDEVGFQRPKLEARGGIYAWS